MITIVDEPYDPTPIGQKLMVVATSDNVTEDGFKFKVTITDVTSSAVIYTGYLPANPSNVLILDYNQLISFLRNAEIFSDVSIHGFIDGEYATEPVGLSSGYISLSADILEAWIVDGVLTDDPDTEGAETVDTSMWGATFQARNGYKPSVVMNFALDENTDRWCSDRAWDTHRWQLAATFGLGEDDRYIFIPVREADFGVLSMIRGITGDNAASVGVSINDSTGTPHNFSIDISGVTSGLIHLPLYPANLNASEESGWEQPSDYSGWRYISVTAVSGGSAQVSAAYILYNADRYGNSPCLHNNVRLGWVNSRGGWDYFNFYQKNELTDQIERKQYRKVLGTYGETYTMTGMERGLTDRATLVEQSLLFTSDWISENEFVLLRGLLVSKQVCWVQDDGTSIPVVIEDTSFIEKRERNGKLQQVTLRLKSSNDYWT